jgi:membrane-bound lytic murein transglycosylase A
MKKGAGGVALLLLLLLAAGIGWYWWSQQKPGPLRLTQMTFADLPGWPQSNAAPALAAFRRSCAAPGAMGGAAYAGTAQDWRGPCDRAAAAKDARQFFEENFIPFAIGAGGQRSGIFTGYYEPQLRGSRTRHGRYQTPVYGLPPDLVRVDLGLFSPRFHGEHVSGRLAGQKLVPFAPRAVIDRDGLPDAPVLFYGDDPVAIFFLQIQGSGRVMLDGKPMRVAYAGENGQPYTAIGHTLVARGALARSDLSLQSIRAWLKANPEAGQEVMESDKSFVFFRLAPIGDAALGSPGAEGVNLTPLASLAVDQRLHPLGAPFFVASDGPGGLFVAQDIGGAIRGAVRGDIFFGFGNDAERRAGTTKAQGQLFVLLPNAVAARLGQSRDFPAP